MSRTEFVRNNGFACETGSSSWSFPDHKNRRILIGAWTDLIDHDSQRALVLSSNSNWRLQGNGRPNPHWPETQKHLELVESQAYGLFIYRMECLNLVEAEQGKAREIAYFSHEIIPTQLIQIDSEWWARFEEPLPEMNFV